MDPLLYLPLLAAFAIVNIPYTLWCMKNTLHCVVLLVLHFTLVCYHATTMMYKLDKIILVYSENVNPVFCYYYFLMVSQSAAVYFVSIRSVSVIQIFLQTFQIGNQKSPSFFQIIFRG